MLEIPLRNDQAAFRITVQLDGVTYRLRFSWNGRVAAWMIDLLTSADVPIVTGVQLVGDWDLFGRFIGDALPKGRLVLVDTSGKGAAPGRYELWDRVKLVYVPAEELP